MNFPSVSVPASIVSERFSDEAIVVNLSQGRYYSLRGSAFTLWKLLDQGRPVAATDLADSLTAHYDVAPAVAHEALLVFLQKLQGEGLIQEAPAANGALAQPATAPRLPFDAPTLEVYTDMEELLALDPIHDVNPAEGWPLRK